MTSKHLTEEQIQQYVLEEVDSQSEIKQHIQWCEECKATADVYRLMFSGIKESPAPIFDFDLSHWILVQLPQPPAKRGFDKPFIYLLVFSTTSFVLVFVYLLHIFLALFRGPISIITDFIVTTIFIILLINCFDLFRNYEKKIESLNVY